MRSMRHARSATGPGNRMSRDGDQLLSPSRVSNGSLVSCSSIRSTSVPPSPLAAPIPRGPAARGAQAAEPRGSTTRRSPSSRAVAPIASQAARKRSRIQRAPAPSARRVKQ